MKHMVIILCCLFVFSCNTEDKIKENPETVQEEFPTKSITLWSDKTELFVEFPALVVNEPSKFAAHFTVLEGHKPITKGELTVNLIKKENIEVSDVVSEPSSPGIFSPTITPKSQGNYQLVFHINTGDYKDKLIIEDVIVYNSKAIAIEALGTGDEVGGITFFKEQAWKMGFQTAPVIKKEVHEAITTFGVWEAAPSDFQTLVANASGKVTYAKANITVGTYVKKGETIMTVSGQGFVSNNLSTEIQKAKAIYTQAEATYNRKKQLFESKIISKAEWEMVERDYRIAKEEYQKLASGYSSKGKSIKAPFNGYIQALHALNGDFVSEGETLLAITDSRSSLLKIQVSSKYANKLQNIANVWYQIDGENWSNTKRTKGEILSVDKSVSVDKPMLLVYAKVNDAISMPIGSVTQATLSVGQPEEGLVIPTSALLEDYGNYTVIVQLSGENFDKRQVTVGKQNGDEVQILSGLKLGEFVVAKGAYQVKTASMSGEAPAHGHAH